MEGTRGMASWQWLFLIEGVIAVAVGLVNATILPTFPDRIKSSRFLTNLEIRVGLQRSLGSFAIPYVLPRTPFFSQTNRLSSPFC